MSQKACQREPCQDLARRTVKIYQTACNIENRAKALLGRNSKASGKLATKKTVPGLCLPQREPCQDLARRTFKMSRKACQREPCQDLARRTFKMPRKACHKTNRARTLLGGPSKMSRRACHKENRARTLLGGPSKCPGKLATKRTVLATQRTVPGPC